MKKCLLVTVLALVSVWATGCIVIDAEKSESRRPAALRSDECVVYQSQNADTPPGVQNGYDAVMIAER
jgi:hypothetical protein